MDKAAIPLAEDAIPLLWGKELVVSMEEEGRVVPKVAGRVVERRVDVAI